MPPRSVRLGAGVEVHLQNSFVWQIENIGTHVFISNCKDKSEKCYACSLYSMSYLASQFSGCHCRTSHPLIPFCGVAVVCSLAKLQQGDSTVTHYLNFLFRKESNQYFMTKIPVSQSYSFVQLIFAAVHILMLLLIPGPCEGQLSVNYSTFFKELSIIYLCFHPVMGSHKAPKLSRQKTTLALRNS